MTSLGNLMGQLNTPLETYMDDTLLLSEFAEAMINQKPINIIVTREVTGDPEQSHSVLAAQKVRLELAEELPYESPLNQQFENRYTVVVLGYKNHPTIADTDLRKGDLFQEETDPQGIYLVKTLVSSTEDRLLAIAVKTQDYY